MKNMPLILKKIDKQRIEQLLMSIISGFLVSLYFVFLKKLVILFRENLFLEFTLVFLTFYIINYYIQNLRKYFLSDKLAIILFLFVGVISYIILK